MRYSDAEGARLYGAGAANVTDLSGPVTELPDGVSADAAPKTGASRGSGFGSAGSRTKAQAAAAAQAASTLLAGLSADTAVAFTDGSCKGNPGPAGSGVSLRLPDGRRADAARALGTATNNVAELTAVGIALDLLDEAGVAPDAPVALLTDSSYGHGVLCKGWKAKANTELITGLRARLKRRPGLTVYWVAGHAGIDGNEAADALANDGVTGASFVRWT
ncbi:MAG: reverse transcriptase-like protein [Alphaproteobacteria bacterium]|nr:reverse transcriptase-like protein [Alphaproteobacteria bacterium]